MSHHEPGSEPPFWQTFLLGLLLYTLATLALFWLTTSIEYCIRGPEIAFAEPGVYLDTQQPPRRPRLLGRYRWCLRNHQLKQWQR